MRQTDKIPFSAPGCYRIEVFGYVQPERWERFGSMDVTPYNRDNAGDAVTALQGILRDQAELSGILNSLHELHFPLLSVTYLGGVPEE